MGKNLFKYIPLVLNLKLFNAVRGSGNVPNSDSVKRTHLLVDCFGGLAFCGLVVLLTDGFRVLDIISQTRKQIWSLPTVRHCAKMISDFLCGLFYKPRQPLIKICMFGRPQLTSWKKINPHDLIHTTRPRNHHNDPWHPISWALLLSRLRVLCSLSDFQQDFSVAAATNSWWLFSVPFYQLSLMFLNLPFEGRWKLLFHTCLHVGSRLHRIQVTTRTITFATIAGSSSSNAIWG